MRHRGTVRRFLGDGGMVVVGIERRDGVFVALPVARGLAKALVARYGAVAPDGVDMTAIVGRSVIYEESEVGAVERLDVTSDVSSVVFPEVR
jgi:hypothetical protein